MTAAWTIAQLESVTRRDVLTRFLRESGLGEYGTATGGTSSTIVDTTRLKSAQYADDAHNGKWARISYDAGGAGAAPEGEISPITDYVASTGTLTVNPAFSVAVASGDVYQIWSNPHPQDVMDHLDNILKNEVYLPAEGLCTEIPDGDMEQAGTSDWTAVNANLAKSTSEPAMDGVRWLSVATTGAGGYARSALIGAIPGKRYFVSADVRATASGTTPRLIAFDETNSSSIDSRTAAQQDSVRVWFEFNIPPGCHQLSIRLANDESGVTSVWDNVVLQCLDKHEVPLPWWVRSPSQVKGIYRVRPNTVGTNLWEPVNRGERDGRFNIRDDAFGRGQLSLVCRHGFLPPEPIFVKGTRNETAFASENADAKRIDSNFIQAARAFHVFQQLSAYPNSGTLNIDWIREKLIYWSTRYEREKYKQQLRLEQLEQSPQPDGLFYRDRGSRYTWEDRLVR